MSEATIGWLKSQITRCERELWDIRKGKHHRPMRRQIREELKYLAGKAGRCCLLSTISIMDSLGGQQSTERVTGVPSPLPITARKTKGQAVNQLSQNAVLMRLSIGMPGEHRQDAEVTAEVKREKNFGEYAGRWVKLLYPPEAMAPIKKLCGEATRYHDSLTLPFDRGTGILPAVLIMEYTDKMRNFHGQIFNLVETHFLANSQQWVDWASAHHNGSFDPSLYPGCATSPVCQRHHAILDKMVDVYSVYGDKFAETMREKFYFKTEPIPVPDSTHFANTVASLLGTDTESVDARVADAAKEAQQELLRRMIDPVANMVKVLSSDKPRIFDTLVANVDEICRLAPALNLAGDPAIDAFVVEMRKLTTFKPDDLRENEKARKATAVAAEEMVKRLSGYRL